MQSSYPLERDLVLIGGGHSHALVIKMWAMHPVVGVRLTLISPQANTPYSGMLPGLISATYSFDDSHIDLARLCQYAGVRFLQDAVTAVDADKKTISLKHFPDLHYDLVSINTGITPDLSIPGAKEFATPVKPIATFYPRWQELTNTIKSRVANTDARFQLVVVGGGAAGVELILAMQQGITRAQLSDRVSLHLVYKGAEPLNGYPASIRQKLSQLLRQRGINCHAKSEVVAITERALSLQVAEELPSRLPCDRVFLCTSARPSGWLENNSISKTERGYLAVRDTLQTVSHDDVFAAGDTAEQVNHPRPKAGVFAVRQGAILFHNLSAYLRGRSLRDHKPQKSFLSLLACGDDYALGCRVNSALPSFSGAWVWRWKDRIDRKFMAMFDDLEVMQPSQKPVENLDASTMRCGGCGAKVGAPILSRVLQKLTPVSHDNVLVGLRAGDDASVLAPAEGHVLVQSIDQFRAFIDNPFLVGRIAAEHALSDVFAMNAEAHSALVTVALPHASDTVVERELSLLMQGVLKTLNRHGCELLGGHTSEAQELSVGLSINGFTRREQLTGKSSLKADQHLILTQGLGTGTLLAAHQQLQCQGVWLEQAIEVMLSSNCDAAKIFQAHQASACTDITGFGLLGHLLEMHKADFENPNPYQSTLWLEKIPTLKGAKETLKRGVFSSLQPQNQTFFERVTVENEGDLNALQLLIDPQTSGGLLAAVPKACSAQCLTALRQAGYNQAAIIGFTAATDVDDAPQNPVRIC